MKKLILIITAVMLYSTIDAQEFSTKINEIVKQLSLEEKASLCSGRDSWSTKPIERLDIPWIWLADGPHGLRKAPATDKAGFGDQVPATCFPTASALAATWDVDLIYKVGQALGEECQTNNVNILLGPGVNIKRSPLGGRSFEFFSEDPILSGEMGAAYINGVQSEGVGTSLKHYVANNAETNRMYLNSDVDTRSLHEIYLPSFEIAVKKSNPWTIMACYNRVQGEYGTQSPYLLTKILREDWGYKGIVISDWLAIVNRVEAVKAGLNLEMPNVGDVNDSLIVMAVKSGNLDEAVLDNLVKEILNIVFKAKSMEKKDFQYDKNKHHEFAGKVASEAATLLKNKNNILPVNSKKYKKIAIIGEFAENPRYQGNGSSEVKPTKLDNVLQILKAEYGKEIKVSYSPGYSLKDDLDFSKIDDAVNEAGKADLALVFAGLPLQYESEGIDRKHISMPESHNKLISAIAAKQPNTVVILTNGSAVSMPWINDVEGVLETWLGGQAGAGAAVDILFGKTNPSGKLSETFPVRLEDTPAYFNFTGEDGNANYGERMFVGYRYYDARKIEPLFPFGYGLSYTSFEYSEMKVSSKNIKDTDILTVSLKVKNTGSVSGKEVVQIYVSDSKSSLIRPEKELKKFAKVELKAGETKEVKFELNARDFSYFDARHHMWIAESGEFIIQAAASSRDIRLSEKINLQSTQSVPLDFDEFTFVSKFWKIAECRRFLADHIPEFIKRFNPDSKAIENVFIDPWLIEQPIYKYPYITDGEISMEEVYELIELSKKLSYTP